MKKIIMIALVAFTFATTYAQDDPIKTEAGTFGKPVKGTWIMELNMTPDIVGGGIFSLPTLNSDLGMVGLKTRYFTSDKRALRISANISIKDSGEDHVKTESAIGLAYGVEYHMKGAERLSTYWGWEANMGNTCVNNDWGTQTKMWGYGASLFSGFDYYIIPKVYLGAELSYGVAVTSTKVDGSDSVTGFKAAPGVTPSFRLGWQF